MRSFLKLDEIIISNLYENGLFDGVDPVLRLRLIQATLAEWPLLILGVLGIVATRIINFIVDYLKEWICSYFKNKKTTS
jgi:hypothetical protein